MKIPIFTIQKISKSNFSYKTLKTFLVFIILGVSSSVNAQNFSTEVEIFQEVFGIKKQVAIANFMNLGEDAKGFWDIYNEYEEKRKELGKERIEIIATYVKQYQNITDDQILDLFKRRDKMNKAMENLQRTYFKKMKKELGVSKAAQFWQIEAYINSIISANIYSEIPFIGENLK